MADSKETKTTPFVRNATGLVKSISPTDVFVFTLMVAGPIVFIPLAAITLPSAYEGVSPIYIMLLTLGILIPFSYNTVCLVSSLPRAGGDYVFGSRIVHPIWGMIPAFMNLFSMIVGSGTIGISGLQAYFGPTISTAFPSEAKAVANLVFTPSSLFLLNLVIILGLYGLAIARTKWWFYFLRIVTAYGLLMVVVFIGFLLLTPHATIVNNFNTQNLTGYSMTGVTTSAAGATWNSSVAGTIVVGAGALIFVLLFLAAPISAFFAGEMKNATRSITVGMFGGSTISWILATAGALGIIYVFGYSFMSAFGFEAFSNPATNTSGLFNFSVLVQAVVGNPTLTFLIGLGIALASLGFLAGGILPASRILFAWSFDRMIPARFASVNSRTNTPIFALVFLIIAANVVSYISSFSPTFLGPFLAFSVIVVVAFLPNGITAALLPFLKKDIYRSAPSIVQKKIAGFPLLTISGIIHALAFGTILALVFANPAYAGTSNGALGPGALAVIAVAILISIIFYPIAKAIRKSQGIDLDAIYKEIPPE